MYRTKNKRQAGFTLVELTLAIAFIGFLVLFTVLATLQVMRTYNKGLAVKEINQTSRTIVDEMARAVRVADFTSVNTTPNDEAPTHSRVCMGGISYVWNIADQTINKFSSPGNPPVTFVRVNDPSSSLCAKVAGVYPNVDRAQATELLTTRVWVQRLRVTKDVATGIANITIQLSTTDDPSSPTLETMPDGSVRCKGAVGDEFCAAVTLSMAVAMRGND